MDELTSTLDDTSACSTPDEPRFESEAVHVGIPRAGGAPLAVPIVAAAAFQFDSLEHGADVFATNEEYSYSRLQNPTVEALEARLAALEGASHALATASGQAATLTAILSVCRAGDHIVATSSLFGGTSGLLLNVLPNFGIMTSLVPNDPASVEEAMREQTRLVWTETIGNPAADVPDFSALAEIAHRHGAVLGVDNTWGGVGFLCRPLAFGADIVTHSLTKWAGGHGAALGGAVLVGSAHDLTRNDIFSCGSPSLLEQRGSAALAWRQRWLGVQQSGMILAPHAAHLLTLGLETVALRLRQSCASALELARRLEAHGAVRAVGYPGLASSPHHALASRYLSNGFGAVLTFEVDDPSRLLSRLSMIRIAPNLGDTRSMVIHPWTTTHGRLPEAQRLASGVNARLVRFSVGIEHVEDLWRDLERALEL